MLFSLAIGCCCVLTLLIVMARIDILKFMGYPAVLDLLVVLAFAWFLHGSYAGLVAAMLGGLLFSIVITVIRRVFGYKRIVRNGAKLQWQRFPPMYNLAWKQPSRKVRMVSCVLGVLLIIAII